MQKIFAINEIHLDLFFITLKPADFLDLDVVETISEEEQQKEGVEMSKQGIEVKDDKVCLDYFDEIGIQLDDDEWHECYAEKISDHKTSLKYHEFAYAPAGHPNEITKASDLGMFRLLYRYSQNLSHNSRQFCQKMVAKSQAGTLYNIDDLRKASNRAVNSGFGPDGSNTYDIALYKGGANCKHHWERVWYFRKKVPKGVTFVDMDGKEYTEGEYLPNGTLNQYEKISEATAQSIGYPAYMPADDVMRIPTYDLPNHGFLK